jgi:hypothetical protein
MTDAFLARASCRRYTAGVIVRDCRIVEAAPILRRFIGRRWSWFRKHCRDRHIELDVIGRDRN